MKWHFDMLHRLGQTHGVVRSVRRTYYFSNRFISLKTTIWIADILLLLLAMAVLVPILSNPASAQGFVPSISLVPTKPQPGDSIVVQLSRPLGGCTPAGTISVQQLGQTLRILHTVPPPVIVAQGTCGETFIIAQGLVRGTYYLEWGEILGGGAPIVVASLAFAVAADSPPRAIPTISLVAIAILGLGLVGIARRQLRRLLHEG